MDILIVNKNIYLNFLYVIFFLLLIPIMYRYLPDTYSQDKLEYFRSWYLYPRYIDDSLFTNSIDCFLRLLFFLI